jgi:CheY-like chemotaxis protein
MSTVKLLGGNIDLAIVDVGLPDGKGDRLAAELRTLYPRLPIVIASGYDNDELRRRFAGDDKVQFIGKPYTQADLQRIVEALPRGRS